jgi:regulator of sirC expression with transglutaminase-like and TPR domain
MGRAGMDRLEAEWEVQHDPAIQAKLEEVIHKISLRGATDELLKWRKGGGKDLLEGWFLLTRFQYPELSFTTYRNEVNRLVNKTWLEINNRMDSLDKVKVLNHILFVMEGYHQNKENAHDPRNFYLNVVTEKHAGNPYSLGLLYLIVAEKLDLPVYGVLLPGYFVLMYIDGDREFYIDAFNGGRTFSRSDLSRFLKEMQVEEKPSYFKPTSNIYMVLAMLRGLMTDYRNNGQDDRADDVDQLLRDIDIRFE